MEVKSLVVKIGADLSEFNDALRDSQSKLRSAGEGMKKAGMGLTTAVTLPILGIGVASTKMGMEAVESENLFKESMKGMADETRQWSEKLRAELGLNAYEVRKNTGMFYTMFESMGLGTQDAYNLSTGLTKLSYDMASFYNLKPEEAFEKLRSGMTGISMPLKQLGIVVDETTIKTYAYKHGIAEQGKELTTQQKLLARYGVIMEATSTAQGDLGRTIETPTNMLRIMGEKVKNLAIDLGMALLPAFQSVLTTIQPLINILSKAVQWFASLPQPIKNIIIVLMGFVVALGPVLMIVGKIIMMLPALGTAFAILTGPIGIAYAAIMGLVVVGMLVYQNWDKISKFLVRIWEYVKAVFVAVWNTIKSVFGGVINIIVGYYTFLYKTFITITMAIVNTVVKAWNWMKVGVSAIIKAVAEFVINNILWLMDQIAKIPIVKKFVKNLQEGLAAAKASIAESSEKIKTSTKEIATTTEESGKKIKATYQEVDKAAQEMKEKIVSIRNELADKIAQATMKEYEYSKWSLEQQRIQREAAITKEITDVGARNQLLLQSKQAYETELAALEKEHRNKELEEKIAFAQKIKEEEALMALARIAALQSFKDKKQELTDALNEMTMSQVEYTKWALEQERLAEEEAINKSTELNQAQKDELLKILQKYYKKKKKLAEDDASGWLELVRNTTSALTSLLGNFFMDTLDAFQKWGEGGGNILSLLGECFKSLAREALDALKGLATGALVQAAREVIAAKAVAIANMIKSVMTVIPFPLNLALVGGAIAAVSALFKAIHFEKGGLVPKDMLAFVHKGELITPHKDYKQLQAQGMIPALAGAGGVNLKVNFYSYGNINNVGDLDAISERLALKMRRAVEGGRR